MTSPSVHGIHHVTVITGDAQENYDFYTGVMGMRLVKKSVNQDAPDTYHLFYADRDGTPGTDLTFFPWPDMRPGKRGAGQIVEVSFAIPVGSLSWWEEHMEEAAEVETRFGEKTLPFQDPHGLHLALVETDDERRFAPWEKSTVPAEHQLRGMHAIRLWERELEPTEALLTDVMGLEAVGEEESWRRYGLNGGASGTLAEVRVLPEEGRGRWGHGTIHHTAWQVTDDEEEMAVRRKVEAAGLQPTPQIDRFWFRSVYFREPGGALFELATEGPGFGRDEDMDHLGEKLILPPWFEARREEIEAGLPELKVSHPEHL